MTNDSKIKSENYKRVDYPKHLYKYYALTEYAVDALTGKESPYLYFSHPNQLNDIFDGSDKFWDLKNLNQLDYSRLLQGIYGKIGINNKKFIEMFPNEKLVNKYKKSKEIDFEDLKLGLSFLNAYGAGVLSLTTKPNINLMWAHYSQEDGFVLELDTDRLKTSTESQVDSLYIYPIDYDTELKKVNFSEYIKYQDDKLVAVEPMLYYFSVKDANWKYEEEWRFLIFKNHLGSVENRLDYKVRKLRDHILNQNKEVKQDIFDRSNRKVAIDRSIVTKVILGQYFFNNFYFSDTYEENGEHHFLFKLSTEIPQYDLLKFNNFKRLLRKLQSGYDNDIEQIGIRNIVRKNGNTIFSYDVLYKIKIVHLDEHILVIQKSVIEE